MHRRPSRWVGHCSNLLSMELGSKYAVACRGTSHQTKHHTPSGSATSTCATSCKTAATTGWRVVEPEMPPKGSHKPQQAGTAQPHLSGSSASCSALTLDRQACGPAFRPCSLGEKGWHRGVRTRDCWRPNAAHLSSGCGFWLLVHIARLAQATLYSARHAAVECVLPGMLLVSMQRANLSANDWHQNRQEQFAKSLYSSSCGPMNFPVQDLIRQRLRTSQHCNSIFRFYVLAWLRLRHPVPQSRLNDGCAC